METTLSLLTQLSGALFACPLHAAPQSEDVHALGNFSGLLSYSLNSLKGGYMGTTIGVIKGATRSLDYSSFGPSSATRLQPSWP